MKHAYKVYTFANKSMAEYIDFNLGRFLLEFLTDLTKISHSQLNIKEKQYLHTGIKFDFQCTSRCLKSALRLREAMQFSRIGIISHESAYKES